MQREIEQKYEGFLNGLNRCRLKIREISKNANFSQWTILANLDTKLYFIMKQVEETECK